MSLTPEQRGSGIDCWVTKYALTAGIERKPLRIADSGYAYSLERFHVQYGPTEWHQLREQAVAKAEDMRRKKIASLRKQIAKLEGLSFDE